MRKYKQASDIKVGVVGYGGAFNMGAAHLHQMKAAGMTPVAVTEIDTDRLKVAEKDFPGIQTFGRVSDMLRCSDIDLIVIITPHNTHAKLALECLKAGRHVVCEKPLAITTAECDAMIRAATKADVLLSTYHNRHWDGCILKAVDVIRKGTIGDVVRIEAHMGHWGCPGDWWRSSRSISGGILYDWGVHLLEYSLQLLDGSLTEVSGYAKTGVWTQKTKWGEDTNEDEGYLVARFDNGQWLTLTITSIDSNPKPCILEITGTKGSYLMNHGDYQILLPREGGVIETLRGPNPPGEGQNFYQNIADHLTKNTPLIITPEWSRRPIHILDLGVASAKLGKAQKARYA